MPLTPFVLLGACWTGIVLVWLAWAAGRLTAWVSGRPAGPAFGQGFIVAVLHSQWETAYPGINRAVVAGVFAALVAVLLVPLTGGWVWWQARRGRADDPLPSLAHTREVAGLAPAGAAARAKDLRPGLAGKPLQPADIGLPLGVLQLPGGDGPLLRASWEDGILAVMGPRAMKTTAIAVPQIVDAPGAVLATSNRADVWATTHRRRAQAGRVWLFDPQAITRTGQSWWWDPLAAVATVEDAARMASHFVQPMRRDRGEDFWLLAAEDLLASLFLAAATSGAGMNGVQTWLADATDDEPVGRLFDLGYPQTARALRGRQNGAAETRDGIYETARTAARCLQDPRVMAWVTASDEPLPRFDPDAFPVSTDTIYLLSKDGAGSSGPLVAALTDQIMRYAVRRAEALGGRLDPPMLCMLDEAANICPLADLPQLYSHFGGRGINLVTILQTYQQGTTVWGERGMGILWGAATIKLVGAGADDPRFASDISTLIGEHDVATLSLTRDATGYVSRQVSVRRQRILGPEDIRAIARGTAILFATGSRAALVALQPWFRGAHAVTLTEDTAAAVAAISDAADRERLQAVIAEADRYLPAPRDPGGP
ncbi:type IV secretory system conjugative DNA transfer family protein [Catenuloplanes japonicus]|uniref:type IV secretory system conjugative DNA transfer family protein n=1 Tax=Catenuloplanes japonicus TaxID=33876 RepID=UPI00068C8B6F|nr:type IV secretory system conjugative DNA transfer family protein [Catenuloplanes japonicus]